MRCRAHLILSKCYSLDFVRSWRGWITLDSEMSSSPEWYSLDLLRLGKWRTKQDCKRLSSPYILRVLLTGFAEVVKMANQTGQWDAKLALYFVSATHWICWVCKNGKLHWIVRCQARLILSKWNSPDFLQWLIAQPQNKCFEPYLT